LRAALESGSPVIPLFLLDDRILEQRTMDARRLRFLRTALIGLNDSLQALGSRLLVLKTDDVPRELNRLAEENGAWSLYFNRDYTPYARARDTRATRGLQLTGVLTQLFNDRLLVEPHLMMDEDGHITPDFDAFYQRWLSLVDVTPDAPAAAGGPFAPAALMPPSLSGWEAPWADQVAEPAPPDPQLALHFGSRSIRDAFCELLDQGSAAAEAGIIELARREFGIHQRFVAPAQPRESTTLNAESGGISDV